MHPIHFSLPFVQFLAAHRTPLLTQIFLFISAFGGAPCYVLIVLVIYATRDKILAVRLSYLVLLTMSANDLLKDVIRNPRPFLVDGDNAREWAVSAAQRQVLAGEFSTPSGHAMGSSAFYGYLALAVRRRWLSISAAAIILLIGFSRPYLGVHYGEDILIGWCIGLLFAFTAARFAGALAQWWRACPYLLQIALAVAASLMLCAASAALNGWRINGSLSAMTLYTGFLTGNVIALPLEARYVGFRPGAGTALVKSLRVLVTVCLAATVLVVLRFVLELFVVRASVTGLLVQYAGYATTGVAGMFLAPLVFTRLKLAEQRDAESLVLPALPAADCSPSCRVPEKIEQKDF